MNRIIYKICGRKEWDSACASGVYRGSADDARDGFIHFSAVDQLAGTLEKHFAGRDDLLLLAVDAKSLGSALEWEASRGGALFPHLYAPLEISAVAEVHPITRGPDGRHRLPGEVA